MDKQDLQKAMNSAQEMQLGLLQVQEELNKIEVTGNSANNLAHVSMSGQGDTKSVQIHPDLLAQGAPAVEAAVLQAIQDSTEKAAKLAQDKMTEITQKLGINQ